MSTRSLNIAFASGTNWPEARLNYRYGMLVCTPPDPLRAVADELRLKYDPQYAGSAPPFIVITQPFSRAPDTRDLEELRKAISGIRGFPLRVGPAIPSPHSRQLCFDVWPQQRLLDLREQLHETGLFRTDLKFTKNYMFHMKLTDSPREPQEIDQLVAEVNKQHGIFETFCSELKWMVPFEDFAFSERMAFFMGQSTRPLTFS